MGTKIKRFETRIFYAGGPGWDIGSAKEKLTAEFDEWQKTHTPSGILGVEWGKSGDFGVIDYSEGRQMYWIEVLYSE